MADLGRALRGGRCRVCRRGRCGWRAVRCVTARQSRPVLSAMTPITNAHQLLLLGSAFRLGRRS